MLRTASLALVLVAALQLSHAQEYDVASQASSYAEPAAFEPAPARSVEKVSESSGEDEVPEGEFWLTTFLRRFQPEKKVAVASTGPTSVIYQMAPEEELGALAYFAVGIFLLVTHFSMGAGRGSKWRRVFRRRSEDDED
jgi:hypothetical protein